MQLAEKVLDEATALEACAQSSTLKPAYVIQDKPPPPWAKRRVVCESCAYV